MPFSDPEERKRYAREWARKRRADWLAGQRCKLCGSQKDLHVFGSKKLGSSAFTSNNVRREKMLAVAIVVCDSCCIHGENGLAMLPPSLKPAPKPRPTTRAGRRERSKTPIPKKAVPKPTPRAVQEDDYVTKQPLTPKQPVVRKPKAVKPTPKLVVVEDEIVKKKPNPLTVYKDFSDYEAQRERKERMKQERDERRAALGYGGTS